MRNASHESSLLAADRTGQATRDLAATVTDPIEFPCLGRGVVRLRAIHAGCQRAWMARERRNRDTGTHSEDYQFFI